MEVRSKINHWNLTDIDSYQYVKPLAKRIFHCIEIGLINPEKNTYLVYTATIDLDEYRITDIKEVLRSFGYNTIKAVREHYGAVANQVIAECIFEYYSYTEADMLFSGEEVECVNYIDDYLKQNM